MALDPTSSEFAPRQVSIQVPESEKGPKIYSFKEIISKDEPSLWVITKKVETIEIKTEDIKFVQSVVDHFSVCKISELRKEFNERAARWEKESSIHSSPGEKFIHRDYLRIIGKGEQVVPLILERLKTSKKDWLFALENIVPEEENPANGIENFKDAVTAWLDWGENKYPSLE